MKQKEALQELRNLSCAYVLCRFLIWLLTEQTVNLQCRNKQSVSQFNHSHAANEIDLTSRGEDKRQWAPTITDSYLSTTLNCLEMNVYWYCRPSMRRCAKICCRNDAILKLYSEQSTVNNHIKNTVVITQKIICRISPDCTKLKTDETWNTVIVTQMCRPL